MNNFALRLAAAALPLALLPACSGAAPAEPPPLEGARIGGPLNLIDQNGRRFDDGRLAGRFRLVYFGYAYCPDVCPVDMARLTAGVKALEARDPELGARLQPIFVSVDPERDTPDALRAFASNFHPRLIALTGTAAELEPVKQAWAVHGSRVPGSDDGSYLVDHTRIAYLMGPAGEPLAIVPHDAPPAAIADELQRWMR